MVLCIDWRWKNSEGEMICPATMTVKPQIVFRHGNAANGEVNDCEFTDCHFADCNDDGARRCVLSE